MRDQFWRLVSRSILCQKSTLEYLMARRETKEMGYHQNDNKVRERSSEGNLSVRHRRWGDCQKRKKSPQTSDVWYKQLGQFAALGGEQTTAQLPVLPGDGVSIGYSS